jgi:hypothetical protein
MSDVLTKKTDRSPHDARGASEGLVVKLTTNGKNTQQQEATTTEVFVSETDNKKNSPYRPGSMWRARRVVGAIDQQGKFLWIPFGEWVMVVDYEIKNFNEKVFVLYNSKTVLLVDGVDLGHSFDMRE